MGKSTGEFYVSNVELYAAYCKWYADIKIALDDGKEEPKIPDTIVNAMMRISRRLSYKINFLNYTFKEDMISDALVDCVRFAKNFNINRGINPFSYITTICYNAFLRKIEKERIQRYVKSKIVTDSDMNEFFSQESTDVLEYQNTYIEFLRECGNYEDYTPLAMKKSKALIEARLAKMIIADKGPLDEFGAE